MKKLFTFALPGLILALGIPASATTLTFDGTVFNAGTTPNGGGGEFTANLDSNPTLFDVFCSDFSDSFNPGNAYDVNINSVLSASFASQTRLGSNTTWEYSLGGAYNAAQRYTLAAFLTTQYAGAPDTTAVNGIQDAIWAILDVSTDLSLSTNTAAKAEVTAATSWFATESASPAALTAFENSISIFTNTPILTGMQEMINVTSTVPEPSTFAMIGLGGALIGLSARCGAGCRAAKPDAAQLSRMFRS